MPTVARESTTSRSTTDKGERECLTSTAEGRMENEGKRQQEHVHCTTFLFVLRFVHCQD